MKQPARKTVQDDAREQTIRSFLGLSGSDGRAGVDAYDTAGNPYEIKSSAGEQGISTARDVGLHTITAWRTRYWIITKGRNYPGNFQVDELYVCHPDDLEPFFGELEKKIRAKLDACAELLQAGRNAGMSEMKLADLERILNRGVTVNNPKMPLALCRTCTPLDIKSEDRARAQLVGFVSAHQLPSRRGS